MSVTDPSADPAQPPEGQAEGGEQPYAEFLERVPEDYRGDVEPVFADWNKHVNSKFQEHAEYRKGWEPYEQAGIGQHDPAAIQEALQFAQVAAQDPQAIAQWYQAYAAENGLEAAQQPEQQPGQFGEFDEYGGQQFDPTQYQQLLDERLAPVEQRLQAYEQWFEQQGYEQQQQAYMSHMEGQMAELKEKHAEEFKAFPILEDLTETYAASFINQNADQFVGVNENAWQQAVPKAFAQAQAVIGQIEKGALQSKVGAPSPAEGGGMPTLSLEKPKTISDARGEAIRVMKQFNDQ